MYENSSVDQGSDTVQYSIVQFSSVQSKIIRNCSSISAHDETLCWFLITCVADNQNSNPTD
jgi:hypothetical protein